MFTSDPVSDWHKLLESYRQSLHALTWTRNLLCLKWAKSTNEISQQQERSLFLQILIMFIQHFPSPPPTTTIFPQVNVKIWFDRMWFILTLLAGVRLCCHLDIIGGQQACHSVGFSLPPVRVCLVQDVDQLALGEAQLILIGSSVVVHGDDRAHWGSTRDVLLKAMKTYFLNKSFLLWVIGCLVFSHGRLQFSSSTFFHQIWIIIWISFNFYRLVDLNLINVS